MKDYPYPMQARNEALCPFTRDTQLSGFLTLPKSLLCWGLSPGALLVYGLLLDRGKLSQRSGWTDKQGWVYVIFPACRSCSRREPICCFWTAPHGCRSTI